MQKQLEKASKAGTPNWHLEFQKSESDASNLQNGERLTKGLTRSRIYEQLFTR